jgi:hypothetical protein
MTKFKAEVIPAPQAPETFRLGSAANAGGRLVDNDMWKLLKLAGDSQYNLCVAGDPIEGVAVTLDPTTQDGWAMGSVQKTGRRYATCDGSQAAGTGAIAVGDYVVCGTVVAAGTALSGTIPRPAVRKATYQPGTTEITNVNQIAAMTKVALHPWRVISIGDDGAVGDTCVIERV